MNVDMFFGVNFLFGSVFAWIAFLLLGPAWGISAIILSSLYTIQLWGHGYALIIFISEFIFVAIFQGHKKNWRLVALTLIYWLIVGPIAFLVYKFFLGVSSPTLELIVAKQAVNGIINVCLGLLVYYAILTLKFPVTVNKNSAYFSNFMQIIFLSGIIFPLGLYEFYNLNRLFSETIQQRLDQEPHRLSKQGENIVSILDLETNHWELMLSNNTDASLNLQDYEGFNPIAVYLISDETGSLQLEYGENIHNARNLINTIQLRGLNSPKYFVGCVENLYLTASKQGEARYFLWPSPYNNFISGSERNALSINCSTDWTGGSSNFWETKSNSTDIIRDTSNNVSELKSWLDSSIVTLTSVDAAYPTILEGTNTLRPSITSFQKLTNKIMVNLFFIMTLGILLSYTLNFILIARWNRVSKLVGNFLQAGSIDATAFNPAFKEDSDLFVSLQRVASSFSNEESARKIVSDGFQKLIEDTLTPVFATNDKGTIRFWNKTLEKLTGYPNEDVIGRSFQSLASINISHGITDITESNLEFTFSIKTKAGKYIHLSAHQTILKDFSMLLTTEGEPTEDGELLHFFVAQDQTEATNARAHMVHMSRMAALGEMSSSIAHELNQPLNVISMSAGNGIERMSKGTVPSDYLLAKMRRIEQQALRAGEIIHNIREFALASPEDDIEMFDPVEHCKSAVDLMGEQLRLDSVKVDFSCFPGLVLIEGRPVLFEQVIVNILNNAIQAMKEIQPTYKICKIACSSQDNNLCIEISDTGPGINVQDLSKIFDPFFSTKGDHIGTGIGLYMSKTIVNAMNGDIWAYNSETGAVIAMRIPIAEIISEPSGQ